LGGTREKFAWTLKRGLVLERNLRAPDRSLGSKLQKYIFFVWLPAMETTNCNNTGSSPISPFFPLQKPQKPVFLQAVTPICPYPAEKTVFLQFVDLFQIAAWHKESVCPR
jgi:hypothetical protein